MRFFNLVLSFTCLLATYSYSQDTNDLIEGNRYNRQMILDFSLSNNAYNFMAMGYFLDANNTMYTATKDMKYLETNLVIAKNVLKTYLPTSTDYKPWVMDVNVRNQNHVVNGQEHLISEGYFFRYLGEFIFLIKKDNLFEEDQKDLVKGLKFSFDKWSERSITKYRDQSLLYNVRFNIGANWSVVALFIEEFSDESGDVYRDFYVDFDKQLRLAIKGNSKHINDKVCFIWNSTYPSRFTNQLRNVKDYPLIDEDVSHGNHTVNYILTTIKLDKNRWTTNDLNNISNTILEIVWEPITKSFNDNINGTINNGLKNTGWKQSDGFMKLMVYNKALYPIYYKYYMNNKEEILNSSLGLQFQSNFILYDSTYNE